MKMIGNNKFMRLFVLSAFFSCFTSRAMDLIDAKITALKDERSNMNQALEKRHGNSTMAYKLTSKIDLREIDQKIEKLENEKKWGQSKY